MDQGAHAHSTEKPSLTQKAGPGALRVGGQRGFPGEAPVALSLWKVLPGSQATVMQNWSGCFIKERSSCGGWVRRGLGEGI